MQKIFKKKNFSKKFFLVKENEASFGTNLGTFYLSKWNFQNEIIIRQETQHTFLFNSLICALLAKWHILWVKMSIRQSPKLSHLRLAKAVVEVPLGNTYVRNGIQSPKSCWYTDTCVVDQYLVVPISTHFHELRKQVCFISVMFTGLHKAQ